jgi:hypothetical protein
LNAFIVIGFKVYTGFGKAVDTLSIPQDCISVTCQANTCMVGAVFAPRILAIYRANEDRLTKEALHLFGRDSFGAEVARRHSCNIFQNVKL